MEHTEALAIYAQLVSAEREEYLRQRALRQLEPDMKRMSPEERDACLRDEAFARTLYQQKRRDKVYQALQRGELVQEYHQAEFAQLEPLILSELRRGHSVDLPFLRSVSRSRVTLGKAYAAVHRLEQHMPQRSHPHKHRLVVVVISQIGLDVGKQLGRLEAKLGPPGRRTDAGQVLAHLHRID